MGCQKIRSVKFQRVQEFHSSILIQNLTATVISRSIQNSSSPFVRTGLKSQRTTRADGGTMAVMVIVVVAMVVVWSQTGAVRHGGR